MVLKPGVKPPKHVVVPTREEIRPSNPLTDLCLELRAGEQASYTIRDVEKTCNVTAKLRSVDGQEAQSENTLYVTGWKCAGTGTYGEVEQRQPDMSWQCWKQAPNGW